MEVDGSYEPTMNEIIGDIADGKITNEEEETLSPTSLAKKHTQKTVEVTTEMLKDKDAELKKLEEPPDAFMCPITKEIMLDPVVDKEGNSYERAAIMKWLSGSATTTPHNTSPVTRNPLSQDDLTENRALKNAIHEYYEKTGQEIPEPPPHRRHGPWAHPGDERWLGGGAHHPAAEDQEEWDVVCLVCGEFVCAFNDTPSHTHRGEAVCDECWQQVGQQEQEQHAAAAAAAEQEDAAAAAGDILNLETRCGSVILQDGPMIGPMDAVFEARWRAMFTHSAYSIAARHGAYALLHGVLADVAAPSSCFRLWLGRAHSG